MTHTTNKQTNTTNQTNNAVEVARKCDNVYWLKKAFYMYTGSNTENRAGTVKEPNSSISERRRVKGDRQMADGMGSFSTTNKQTQQIKQTTQKNHLFLQ